VAVTQTALQIAVLGGKTSIAVLLLAAGGAKLADRPGFASNVRLFIPPALRLPHRVPAVLAVAIAVAELGAGAASLSAPQARWLNLAVVAIYAAFVVVWAVGFTKYRGRSCRCFGALSERGFTGAGLVRAVLLLAVAVLATAPVPSASIRLSLADQLGLLAGGALIAAVAYSAATAAAKAAVAGRSTRPRWA
jgi:methylamine utilization protein MauE